ncbi:hypothetical protein HWV01_08430 [Moritella sp. 5]|uniref:hypothetical protein n=1 Tax=Moritella sp. 5 TaxID=2746231 RepID=UPI001BA97EDA|nr:hypothetical protein [Moritella sp. 5]QUM80307.1 hypothetical protein HWV01_08430 [Moritella sp. 5]
MMDSIDRVYINSKAKKTLGWRPKYDFIYALTSLSKGGSFRSQLAIDVGVNYYHDKAFSKGPYPVKEYPRPAWASDIICSEVAQ